MTRGAGLRRTRWILAGLLLLAALSWWALLLRQAESSVFARVPILDEIYYLDRAQELATGAKPAQPYFISPLYPRLIALAGGGSIDADERVIPAARLRGVRLFQIGCWVGIVVLLRLMAGRCLAPLAAAGWRRRLVVWLPAGLFALYRPAAVYTLSIFLELPLTLLVTVALYLVLDLTGGDDGRPRLPVGKALVLGAVLGLAGLLRGSALILLPLGMFAAARPRRRWSGRALAAGLVLAGAMAALGPAVVHNSRMTGRLTGPTLNAGVNLYIGNGPAANGFYVAAVPGDWRRDPAGQAHLAERLGRPEVLLAEADRIWRDRALQEMKARPLRTVGLWLKKVWLHLQAWEIDQLAPLSGWVRAVPLLGVLVVPYGLVAALALVGLFRCGWRRPLAWPALFLGLTIAVQSLFFVVSRYRLAVVPALVLLAGAGLAALLKDPRRAWPVLAMAVLLVLPWGLGETRMTWRSLALANEGSRWAEIAAAEDSPAARERALELYRNAVEGPVTGPAPWLGLAALLIEKGERQEAVAILSAGAEANPGNLGIAKMLVALHLKDGRGGEASKWLQRILRDHPDDADSLHNTTVLLGGTSRTDEALAMARRLIQAHPTDPRGYTDLGILLARAGRKQEARLTFEQGLLAVPGDPGLEKNLSLLDSP